MAFGSAGFAQSKTAELKSRITERVLKQNGLIRQSYVVPQEATYSEVDGTRHRTTYYYDESDFYLTEEVMETYYDFWVNESRGLYDYDFNGNVLQALIQEWGEDDWQDAMMMTYDYDGDVLSEVVYQYNMNGIWTNVGKEVYNFNGDTWTVLYWLWNGTTWSSDMLYTYTNSGNTIELLMQYMEGGAWQNEAKEIYTLDFDENVTEILSQNWEDNNWVNSEKMTYVYEDGVYTRQFMQVWYDASWHDEYKFSYTYDELGNAKHGECNYADGTPADADIEMAYDYNANKATFFGNTVDMIYVDLTGVGENTQADTFTVYPIPASDEIQIAASGFQKAEILSLTGQKLMESLNNTMDVSALSSGLYIINVYDLEGNRSTQRFVVK